MAEEQTESAETPEAAESSGAAEAAGAELDEYGLAVQKYGAMVLVVVPGEDYAETTLRYARSALYNVKVGTRSVSPVEDRLIVGEFQDEFQVDGPVAGESMEAYAGVILVGGKGALALAENADVLRLVREAESGGKMIGAWGHALAVLAKAGVVKGKKVTGEASLERTARSAGGKYTGVQVQRDGDMVTAIDDAAGFRFGRELVQIVGIR